MSFVAAAIGAAATLGGAALMSKGGGVQQAGTSTTVTEPADYIKGEYEALADQLAALRQGGLLGDIQTLSDYERRLIESAMARADAPALFQTEGERAVGGLFAGDPLFEEAANIYRGTSGSIMDSPEFLAASERAVQRAMSPVASQFAGSGRLGSGAFADALTSSSFGAMAPLALEARRQDISTDLSRAAGLAGLGDSRTRGSLSAIEASRLVGQQPYEQTQRGLALGGLLSGEDYALRQAPVTAAERYTDLLRGATVGSQTTQPVYAPRSSTSAILGGTLMASAPAIGQAFGSYFNQPAQTFAPRVNTFAPVNAVNPMTGTNSFYPTGGGNLLY
jgi:hypothetical protein